MLLTQKLKYYERKIVFLRWGNTAEYGKIKYVGKDFIEFEILDQDDLAYTETVLVNPNLILEVVLDSPDIDRVIVEFCSKISDAKDAEVA